MMISLEEAKGIAAEANALFGEFDHWYEYKDAYVFAVSDCEDVGGLRCPFMVMKEDGRVSFAYAQAMMCGTLGDEIADGPLG